MLNKFLSPKVNSDDYTINGCEIIEISDITADFPYCANIVFYNDKNQLGFSEVDGNQIRIDGVITNESKICNNMIDAVVKIAKRCDCNKLFFSDFLKDEVMEFFLIYGFDVIRDEDPNVYYMEFDIDKKEDSVR